MRTNSLGSCARSPPTERRSKLSAFGRFFKPWKWRRKKKRVKNLRQHQNVCICIIQKIIFMTNIYDYFFSIALERKISIRANREILVQKGILLPESPINLSELKQPIYFGAISEVLLLLWCKGLKQTEQDRD